LVRNGFNVDIVLSGIEETERKEELIKRLNEVYDKDSPS
jgi:hypothetical protein